MANVWDLKNQVFVFNFFNFSESSVSKRKSIYRVCLGIMRFGRQHDEDQLSFEEILFTKRIEYILVEFRQSLGMNFVSPFQPKREFKVYK